MKKIRYTRRLIGAFIALIMVPLLAGPGCYLLDDGTYGTAIDDMNRLTLINGSSKLVGEWLFSGNSNDTSGQENNGTLYNITPATDRIGLAGKAYVFNGSSSYIDCGTGDSLNLTSSLTIMAWIKTSMAGVGSVFSKSGDGSMSVPTDGSYGLGINGGHAGIALVSSEGTPSVISGTVTINNGVWHHIAVTADGNSHICRIYVDGSLDTTGTVLGTGIYLNTVVHANIGVADRLNSWGYFSGSIDSVRVYNGALSQSQIKDIMMEGLMGEWLFSGNANDTSGSGNHGAVYGASLTTNRFAAASSAYSFGSGQYIASSAWDNLPLGSRQRTLSVWFRLSSVPMNTFTPIANYGQWGKGALYEVGIWYDSGSGNRYMFFGNGEYVYGHSMSLSTGTWYHLAVTSSGGNWTLYLNGTVLRSDSCPINTKGGPVYFGGYQGYPSDYFPGAIDDLRIFDRQMSDSEIVELYNGL
jgi:hypothetical protein